MIIIAHPPMVKIVVPIPPVEGRDVSLVLVIADTTLPSASLSAVTVPLPVASIVVTLVVLLVDVLLMYAACAPATVAASASAY